MKKLMVGLWVVLASFAGVRVPVRSIQPIVQLRDTGPVNVCTSFSINQAKGLWMTANHCWFEGALFHGRPIDWVTFDERADLAIFQADKAPSLKLAIKVADVGDPVIGSGYANGSLDLLTFFGRVAHPSARLTQDLTAEVFNLVLLSGMSGSPILDNSGRVLGVAQVSSQAGTAWGTPWAVIRAFGQPYWEID